ncbi:MAG: hypothetical protein A3G73_03610, partial [Rhodospirillales bacterium RIFCSPLOWO2_12_FULL_67_15]
MGIRVNENSPRGGKRGRILRAFALAFGAGAVALALSACVTGPTTPPSAAVPPPDALARFDPSAEGVEIAPLEGTPAPMAKLLQRSVVDAFGRYNVPASPSPGGGRYLLSGHAGPNRDPAPSSVVAIEWQIFDRRLGRETGRFTLPVAGDRFAWDNGDPRVIAQVGGGTSRQFVALIDGARPVAVSHGPGEIPGVVPPGGVMPVGMPSHDGRPYERPAFAKPAEPVLGPASGRSRGAGEARPGAEKAAGSFGYGASAPGGGPTKAAPNAEDLAALAPPSAPPSARAGVAPPAPARNGPTVFLARVGGAPGDGDAALAHAARAAFVVGGLGAAARREDARYIVAGSVTVATPVAGRQPVRVVWEVSAPDGRPLGRAVQENAVPEGSLNGAWGPMASLVAGAAVKGIADVIRRAEETVTRAGDPRVEEPGGPRALNVAPLSGRAGESPRALHDAPLSGHAAPSESAERRLKI